MGGRQHGPRPLIATIAIVTVKTTGRKSPQQKDDSRRDIQNEKATLFAQGCPIVEAGSEKENLNRRPTSNETPRA